MITEKNIDNLYRITSNLSYKDYKAGKITGRGLNKKMSYFLSDETKEARDMLGLAYKAEPTREEEEQVKAYLLRIRYTQPELLEQSNPNYEQWKTVRSA